MGASSPLPPKQLHILIVAGVRLYREGLAAMLSRREGLAVVGVESDGREANDAIARLRPDVVLLDTAVAEVRRAIADIRERAPGVRVVALGVADQEDEVLACAEAGVAGYVTREASVEELVNAVQSAARGELHCSPGIAGGLLRRLAALAGAHAPPAPLPRLTAREGQILRLLDEDLSNKEIAVRLGIEVATVKNHVHNLLEKLNVRRRREAVRLLGRSPTRPRSANVPPLPR